MSYLSALKKSSVLDFDTIQKNIESQNAPKFERKEDTRFWKPTRDKAGNAFAVIRFLPPALDKATGLPEDKLYVRIWDHAFQGPTGKWYIEKSLTTIGDRDLIGEYNSYLWNKSKDDNSAERKQARAQKRRTRYISNILVVNDPANPANNGKTFLFSYGKKIYDKINGLMFPKIPGTPRLNPFDPVNGANFNLIMEQVSGFPNYDQSRFDVPAPIDPANVDAICSAAYSLNDFLAPSEFESKDELKTRLNRAMGFDVEAFLNNPVGTPVVSAQSLKDARDAQQAASAPFASQAEDDDDDLESFRQLVR